MEHDMVFLNNIYVQLGIRFAVFGTMIIFILVVERSFRRAGLRGGSLRVLQMVAAFLTGVVVRGLLFLLNAL
jgi:hypothetical protein